MEGISFLIWMIFFTVVYLGLFVIPAIRLKKALYQMIDHFRTLQSSCLMGVKSMEDIGLRDPGLLDGFMRSRDFRPYALQVLLQEQVIQHENEMLCLKEDRLRDFMAKYRL